MRLEKYLKNSVTLTNQEKKNADINNDGKIDATDSDLLAKYLVGSYPNTLPNNPIIK